MTPFLALPKKHMPRAQVIFVVQAGRKFRLFSLTLQRYKKFKALPNYSSKKARILKSFVQLLHATVLQFKKQLSSMEKYHNLYIYIKIKFSFDFGIGNILTVAL